MILGFDSSTAYLAGDYLLLSWGVSGFGVTGKGHPTVTFIDRQAVLTGAELEVPDFFLVVGGLDPIPPRQRREQMLREIRRDRFKR